MYKRQAAHREGFTSIEEKIKEKFLLFSNCDTLVVNGLSKAQLPEGSENKHIIRIAEDGDVVVNKILTAEAHTEIEVIYKANFYQLEIPFTDSASVSNALTCFGVLAALQLNLEEYLPSVSYTHLDVYKRQ